MNVTTEMLAGAMADFFQELVLPLPGAQVIRKGGVAAAISGVASPALNPVWFERPDPKMADVTELLDEVAARGVPFVLGVRPGSDEVTRLAVSRGMTVDEEVPLMAVDAAVDILPPEGLSIRLVAPDEVLVHILLAAEAFEAPEEVFRHAITEDTLRSSAVRCYAGELRGRPVATALSVTTGAFTGIINIATDQRYRGRGFGTAMTARAVEDGLAAGASWCWLQSSAQGYPIYESLGFQTIESWQAWLSFPSSLG